MAALPVVDEYGFAAFCCAADGSEMVPVTGETGVQACPKCGRRTDEPGAGVLGDGFDIVHRQWGMRADPHVWRAMRDRLGATPTPPTPDAVRAAYLDGLRQVAGVDIDSSEEPHVFRPELNHGGMSGGVVNLDWWRTKGIPLLVDRAVERRPVAPAPASGPAKGSVAGIAAGIAIWAILLAIPAALVGGGGWLLYQRGFGTRVEVTVVSCDSSGHFRRFGSTFRTDCVAEWTIDGETVVGNFEGGNGQPDVGRTVSATVRGDTAYSRSLVLPILLILLGLPFLILLILAIGRRITSRDAPETDESSKDERQERVDR